MESSIRVLTKADDISLISLHDALLGLNLPGAPSGFSNEQIELMIAWASDEIATHCGRVFAKEKVEETFFDISADRIFLSRYPVSQIHSLNVAGTNLAESDYHLDADAGKLLITPYKQAWIAPIVITYTGGYDCPNEVPPGLAKAAILTTREAYYAALRGDATVRMVGHKESRVIYFDPNAHLGKVGAAGASSSISRAVSDLLLAYMRIYV